MAKAIKIPACFAPPLSDELLAKYRALIDDVPAGPLRAALDTCYQAAEAWWNAPESAKEEVKKIKLDCYRKVVGEDGKETVEKSTKTLSYQAMDQEIIAQLFDAVPWDWEMKGIYAVTDEAFDGQPETELKTAAYHLRWFAHELSKDREPCTMERIR